MVIHHVTAIYQITSTPLLAVPFRGKTSSYTKQWYSTQKYFLTINITIPEMTSRFHNLVHTKPYRPTCINLHAVEVDNGLLWITNLYLPRTNRLHDGIILRIALSGTPIKKHVVQRFGFIQALSYPIDLIPQLGRRLYLSWKVTTLQRVN